MGCARQNAWPAFCAIISGYRSCSCKPYGFIFITSCHLQKEGCRPNIVTYNTLIDVYGKMGEWQAAVKVLDEMTTEVCMIQQLELVCFLTWCHCHTEI